MIEGVWEVHRLNGDIDSMVGFDGNGLFKNISSRTKQHPNGSALQVLVSGRTSQGSSDGWKVNRDTGVVSVVILPAGW
jgi:hypothetical protein